jgi:hypothetical protein
MHWTACMCCLGCRTHALNLQYVFRMQNTCTEPPVCVGMRCLGCKHMHWTGGTCCLGCRTRVPNRRYVFRVQNTCTEPPVCGVFDICVNLDRLQGFHLNHRCDNIKCRKSIHIPRPLHRFSAVQFPVGSPISTSPYRPYRLWGPPMLLSNDYKSIFPRE